MSGESWRLAATLSTSLTQVGTVGISRVAQPFFGILDDVEFDVAHGIVAGIIDVSG